MLYKIRDRLRRLQFRHKSQGVLRALPLSLEPSSPAIVFTQLPHKDVMMFLVAVRSFVEYVPIKQVHVLDDGTLTEADKDLLRSQLPGLAFHDLAEFRSSACPSGGCWERLLGISDLVRDHYVVQLDSDTLAVAALNEVAACIRDSTSFTLGTWDRQQLEPMVERAVQARKIRDGRGSTHIQIMAEASLDKLPGYRSLRYVRGCAGFAGFGARSFSREAVETLSQNMYAALGAQWNTWGSEQVASNIIVANAARAEVLPHPKYCACNRVTSDTAFIHFIGDCRFKHGTYVRLAKRAIAEWTSHV